MAKPEEKSEVHGALKKRWSLLSLLMSIGLSKMLIGEEAYSRIIEEANTNVKGQRVFFHKSKLSFK